MNIIGKLGFGLLIGLLLIMSVGQIGKEAITEQNDDTALDNSARNALAASVNKGALRVTEEVTINEQVAEEALVRLYADNSNFNGGETSLNIYKISSKPAMIAVDSYNAVDNDLEGFIERFTGEDVPNERISRNREIVIFEAKDLNK